MIRTTWLIAFSISLLSMTMACSNKKQTPETDLPGTWYPEKSGAEECEKPEFDSAKTTVSYDAKTGWFIGGFEWSCEFPGKTTTKNGFEGIGTCGGEGDEWMKKYKAELDSSGKTLTLSVHDYPVKDKTKLRIDTYTLAKCPN